MVTALATVLLVFALPGTSEVAASAWCGHGSPVPPPPRLRRPRLRPRLRRPSPCAPPPRPSAPPSPTASRGARGARKSGGESSQLQQTTPRRHRWASVAPHAAPSRPPEPPFAPRESRAIASKHHHRARLLALRLELRVAELVWVVPAQVPPVPAPLPALPEVLCRFSAGERRVGATGNLPVAEPAPARVGFPV